MFLFRYVIFTLQESPKYLAANGRDEEAIQVCNMLAAGVFAGLNCVSVGSLCNISPHAMAELSR